MRQDPSVEMASRAPRGGTRIILRAAGLALLGSITLLGQQDAGIIYGRVTDSRGHPLSVMVHLLSSGDIPAGDVYTGAQGEFAFQYIPSGEYRVVVEAEGFEPVRQSVRLDTHINASMQVNPVLEPVLKTAAAPSPIVSGSAASHTVDARKPSPSFSAQVLREFDKGTASERRGDLHGAIAHYQKAVRLDPQFYPGLNNLGAAYERQGDHRRAEEALLKALAINPNDGESHVNLGHVLYEEGRYTEARSQLEEALERTPNSATGLFFLGCAYFKLGELDKAATSLQRALGLDPKGLPAAHLQLANVYLRARNLAAADAELQKYLQANPADPQAPAIRRLLASMEAQKN